MTLRTRGAALVAAAVLLSGTPAGAARPTIADGFTVSGLAGSQVVVRVTKGVRVPVAQGADGTLTASSGAFAGFALVPLRGTGGVAYTIETTPRWTCGAETCEYRIRYGFSWTGEVVKGDYVLVLLGEPGARIGVTVPPAAKGSKGVRITTTHRATPVVRPVELVATGTGVDPIASGSWTPPRSTAKRAVFGIVHTVELGPRPSVDYLFEAGRVTIDGCRGRQLPGGSDGELYRISSHSTQAIMNAEALTADLCASVEAQAVSVLAKHRAFGVFVPVVL